MSNKRGTNRQRRRLRVEYGGTPVFTLDVSPGGFCAETMRVLPPGSAIVGKIRLSERDLPFTGRVAWARAGDPRLSLRGRMGVQLTGAPAEFLGLFDVQP